MNNNEVRNEVSPAESQTILKLREGIVWGHRVLSHCSRTEWKFGDLLEDCCKWLAEIGCLRPKVCKYCNVSDRLRRIVRLVEVRTDHKMRNSGMRQEVSQAMLMMFLTQNGKRTLCMQDSS